jgi:putative transposase
MLAGGRALDNIFVERLWRTVKYEDVYLKEYQSVASTVSGLGAYFEFYNGLRLHQSLGYQTPAEVYRQGPMKLDQKLVARGVAYAVKGLR